MVFNLLAECAGGALSNLPALDKDYAHKLEQLAMLQQNAHHVKQAAAMASKLQANTLLAMAPTGVLQWCFRRATYASQTLHVDNILQQAAPLVACYTNCALVLNCCVLLGGHSAFLA